jgi:hypothetical protein
MDGSKNLLYQFLENEREKHSNYYDLLRYQFDIQLYYYGSHLKIPYQHKKPKWYSCKKLILEKIIYIYVGTMALLKPKNDKITILNSAYFNLETHFKSNYSNINISRPPWNYNANFNNIFEYEIFTFCNRIKKKLENGSFNELTNKNNFEEIDNFSLIFKEFVKRNNIQALFVPQSMGFFERLSITIFKDLGLPTFEFIHGLPGIYSLNTHGRADYLMVWGQAIKENFVKNGFDANKIILTGHPKYQNIVSKELKFSFEDILVIARSNPGCPAGDNYIISDRSNIIYYLKTIEVCLKNKGVKKVRFRPHPSENAVWFLKFIDNDFFIEDKALLNDSLTRSTLVIGPTSTVFLESLIKGVNYLVYEPLINDLDLGGYKLVPPFDNSNSKVPVAHSLDSLNKMLDNEQKNDVTIIDEYINSSFSLEETLNRLNEFKAFSENTNKIPK